MEYQLNTSNIDLTTKIVVESLNINFTEKNMVFITSVKTYQNNIEDISKRRTVKLIADNTTIVNKTTGEKNPIMKITNPFTLEVSDTGLLPSEVCGEYDFYESFIQNATFNKEDLFDTIINNAKNENRF